MGITVHYHGTMENLDRIEEFEDRVLDLALELGGLAKIWRSSADRDPSRVVRGLLLDLSPGQETTSLLVAPEGWLVSIIDIEAAEGGDLKQPPHCSVKTQYGSVDGHVALIELLSYLKHEFIPDLEVLDEGGYWEHRDAASLARKFFAMRGILDAIMKGLSDHPLTAEAAEDPAIVAARLERITQQVHTVLKRPPEHPPVHFDEDELDWKELDESRWDESYKEQRRKQESLHRAIEEQLQSGVDHDEAFENAMRNEGIVDMPVDDDRDAVHEEEEEPWHESLSEELDDEVVDSDEDSFDSFHVERHPLQQAASDLHLRIFKLFKHIPRDRTSSIEVLMGGVGEIGGGLAQALSERRPAMDGLNRGLALVQLKRALRGAAFAKGALPPLRADGLFDDATFEELWSTLTKIESGILDELQRVRR